MKKIMLFLALITFTVVVEAKPQKVYENNYTGHILSEDSGIYLICGQDGMVILGNIKDTRNFFIDANYCFIRGMKNIRISCGEFQQFIMDKDEKGEYFTKWENPGLKIRQSDAVEFLTYIESVIVKDKVKKIWNIVKE